MLLATSTVAMAALLTSCSPHSSPGFADSRELGVPDDLELTEFNTEPAVLAYPDRSVKVVTYGSGSCPATATALTNDGSTMVVEFDLDTTGPCTADMAPTTHTFSAEKVGDAVPDRATVSFPEFGEEHVVDVLKQ